MAINSLPTYGMGMKHISDLGHKMYLYGVVTKNSWLIPVPPSALLTLSSFDMVQSCRSTSYMCCCNNRCPAGPHRSNTVRKHHGQPSNLPPLKIAKDVVEVGPEVGSTPHLYVGGALRRTYLYVGFLTWEVTLQL